jgi:FkbM family methyltransferase
MAAMILTSFEDTYSRSSVKLSFSQSGEDVIAWSIFNSLGISQPRYLDIGAHHPLYLSNTALFHFLGSRGMNIEPDPTLFGELRRLRPHDINLNIGVAAANGMGTFYRLRDPALSTFSESEAQRRAGEFGIAITSRTNVPVRVISEVLSEHDFCPDFLSIDVEGHEMDILKTYDFSTHRPAVICVESLQFSTRGDGAKDQEVCSYIGSQGYRIYADTLINTLLVDRSRLPG